MSDPVGLGCHCDQLPGFCPRLADGPDGLCGPCRRPDSACGEWRAFREGRALEWALERLGWDG